MSRIEQLDQPEPQKLRAEALAWLLRLHSDRPSRQLWTRFEDWLAGNPRRRAAYDELEQEWPARRARIASRLVAINGTLTEELERELASRSVEHRAAAFSSFQPRTINRYPNRRLYDTIESRYITLSDIRRMVIERIDFVVIDRRSQDDITRSILLKVIAEQDSAGEPLMSRDFLMGIIRSYGESRTGIGSYLEKTLKLFTVQLLEARHGGRRGRGTETTAGGRDVAYKTARRLRQVQDEIERTIMDKSRLLKREFASIGPDSYTISSRVIQKCANRRLFDTVEGRCITLSDIRRMIIERIDFVVIDRISKEDITRPIVFQIITEQECGIASLMSRDFLTEVIRSHGCASQELIRSYLDKSLKLFAAQRYGACNNGLRETGPAARAVGSVVLHDLAQKNYQRWRQAQDEIYRTLTNADRKRQDNVTPDSDRPSHAKREVARRE